MYGAVSSQVVPGPQVSRVGKVIHSVRAQYGMWLGHRLWTGWFVFERGTQRKISTFLWNWLALRGAILSLSGIKKAPTVKVLE